MLDAPPTEDLPPAFAVPPAEELPPALETPPAEDLPPFDEELAAEVVPPTPIELFVDDVPPIVVEAVASPPLTDAPPVPVCTWVLPPLVFVVVESRSPPLLLDEESEPSELLHALTKTPKTNNQVPGILCRWGIMTTSVNEANCVRTHCYGVFGAKNRAQSIEVTCDFGGTERKSALLPQLGRRLGYSAGFRDSSGLRSSAQFR
jgi:hypothetical protein